MIGAIACALVAVVIGSLDGAAFAATVDQTPAPASDVATPSAVPSADTTPQLPRAMEVVLDASGSMNGDAGDGTSKLAVAKRVLRETLAQVPSNMAFGLRVYGSATASGAGRERGCRDTQLLVPTSAVDEARFSAAIDGIAARGWTPIGRALQAAADEIPTARDRSIVLISDGLDTCGAPPPCAVARSIADRDDELRVNTVGFRVDAAARAELRCIADATGGEYFDADDEKDLFGAFRFYDLSGQPVQGGDTAASAARIGPGQYIDAIPVGRQRWYEVDVDQGAWLRTAATLVPRSPDDRFRTGFVSLELRNRDVVGPLHCAQDEAEGIGTGFTHVAAELALASLDRGPCSEPGARLIRLELVDTTEVPFGTRAPPPRTTEFDVELLVDVRDVAPKQADGAADDGGAVEPSAAASVDSDRSLWPDVLTLSAALLFGAIGTAVAMRRGLRWRRGW